MLFVFSSSCMITHATTCSTRVSLPATTSSLFVMLACFSCAFNIRERQSFNTASRSSSHVSASQDELVDGNGSCSPKNKGSRPKAKNDKEPNTYGGADEIAFHPKYYLLACARGDDYRGGGVPEVTIASIPNNVRPNR